MKYYWIELDAYKSVEKMKNYVRKYFSSNYNYIDSCHYFNKYIDRNLYQYPLKYKSKNRIC